MLTLLPFSQLLLESFLLLGDELELVDPGIGVLDLLVGAFEVKGEVVLAAAELRLILLEGDFYLLVGGLPAWVLGYIWWRSRAAVWRSCSYCLILA